MPGEAGGRGELPSALVTKPDGCHRTPTVPGKLPGVVPDPAGAGPGGVMDCELPKAQQRLTHLNTTLCLPVNTNNCRVEISKLTLSPELFCVRVNAVI